MDQMLLTGLVSCRFSSLAEGSPAGDSLTAPKLRFSRLCKGNRSEISTLEAKGSLVALLLISTPGDSVARMPGTTGRIPTVMTVSLKTI